MGGYAFILPGRFDETKIEYHEENLSFIDRLFGRKSTTAPKYTERGNGDQSVEINISDIEQQMKADFIKYLNRSIANKWPATESVINNYLSSDVLSFYLNGEKRKGEKETAWCFKFSTSSCSGLAQVSATLVCHWIEYWYRDNKASIDQHYLLPKGFTANYRQSTPEESNLFFPLGDLGYAMLNKGSACFLIDEEIETDIDIDAALTERGPINTGKQYKKLEKSIMKYFRKEKRCYCQCCSPTFEPINILEKILIE